jgi:hypothetical protein
MFISYPKQSQESICPALGLAFDSVNCVESPGYISIANGMAASIEEQEGQVVDVGIGRTGVQQIS